MRLSFWFSAVLLLSGCVQGTQRQAHRLIDMDSLLDAQEFNLKGATLHKSVVFDTLNSGSTLQPDSNGWHRELSAFRKLAMIDKPAFLQKCQVSDSLDRLSNLQVRTLTPPKGSGMQSLRLYYAGSLSVLRKVQARFVESGTLFKSDEQMTLEFQNLRGGPMLTAFSLSGGQCVAFRDSSAYRMEGKIDYPHP